MALRDVLFCFFVALLAVNLILADETTEAQPQDKASPFSLPFNPFSFFSQFLPFGGGSSRQARDVSPDEEENANEAPNNRLFFSLGRALVTCNYTATPGLSCIGCYQTLACRPNGVGVQRRCSLYCNSGRCSFVPGSQCLNSTVAG
ncbi:unnamed protein product [Leptosia nina]|uniref:Uncharacterized protein n=1 Tax=Leptosia nina TaxID=320188 RepID=A0AAV1K612_9NEOP